MMKTVKNTAEMIAQMKPTLQPGRYVFCAPTGAALAPARAQAIASFKEAEGWSLLLPIEAAEVLGLPTAPAQALITLQVLSSLEGVGLTAAVATALAEELIPCNVVAAFHHDHIFVPDKEAARAMRALTQLSGANLPSIGSTRNAVSSPVAQLQG